MEKRSIVGYQPSPQQKHLWLLRQADDSLSYRVRASVLIEGVIDVEILKASIAKIIDRHEILRTTFSCLPGLAFPLQVINSKSELSINEFDLSQLDSEKQSE